MSRTISHQVILTVWRISLEVYISFSSRKITNHQVKSLVIKSNPKFAIIERSIVHNISQHQVKVLSHYQASCPNSKDCSSLSISQVMSNSCSTNFEYNDISVCTSRHLQTQVQSIYSYYRKNSKFPAHRSF